MKIAITGGAGFIGTALAGLLRGQGHKIVLLDIYNSLEYPEMTEIVDVTDTAAVSRALQGVDAIYHLAAVHRDDIKPVQKYYDVNVGGAVNVAAAACEHHIKTIIHTSSVAVYGLGAGESRESATPNPFNDYGRSKLESEKIFDAWAAEHPENKLVTVRLVATFGPGNRGNIHTLIDQIARGRFVMVGGGKNRKSIAWIGNVAAFLVHALNFNAGAHLYNYADKPDMTMNELVGAIRQALGLRGPGPKIPYAVGFLGGLTFDAAAQLTGKNFPISAIRVKKFSANTVVNADKLAESGFRAPFTLQNGLREMIAAEFTSKKKLSRAA